MSNNGLKYHKTYHINSPFEVGFIQYNIPDQETRPGDPASFSDGKRQKFSAIIILLTNECFMRVDRKHQR